MVNPEWDNYDGGRTEYRGVQVHVDEARRIITIIPPHDNLWDVQVGDPTGLRVLRPKNLWGRITGHVHNAFHG